MFMVVDVFTSFFFCSWSSTFLPEKYIETFLPEKKNLPRWYFLFGGKNWSGAGGIFYPVVFSNSVHPVIKYQSQNCNLVLSPSTSQKQLFEHFVSVLGR